MSGDPVLGRGRAVGEGREDGQAQRIADELFAACDVLLLLCGGRPLYVLGGPPSAGRIGGRGGGGGIGGAVDRLVRALVAAFSHGVIHRKEASGRRKKASSKEASSSSSRRRHSLATTASASAAAREADSSSDEENPLPFVSASLSASGLRTSSPLETTADLAAFLRQRLLASSLAATVALVLHGREGLVRENYDAGAFLRSPARAAAAVAALACVEELDASGLADLDMRRRQVSESSDETLVDLLKPRCDHLAKRALDNVLQRTDRLDAKELGNDDQPRFELIRCAAEEERRRLTHSVSLREGDLRLYENLGARPRTRPPSSVASSAAAAPPHRRGSGLQTPDSSVSSASTSRSSRSANSARSYRSRVATLPEEEAATASLSVQGGQQSVLSCPSDLDAIEGGATRALSDQGSLKRRPRRRGKTHARSASDTVASIVATTSGTKQGQQREKAQVSSETKVQPNTSRVPYITSPPLSSSPPLSIASSEPFSAGDPPSPPVGGWKPPRPKSRNQSLKSYIADGEFSKHQAQLDRENAHLILSEAVIQATAIANFDKATKLPKFPMLDPIEGSPGTLIGSPPRPSDERRDEEEEEEESDRAEVTAMAEGEEERTDLEILTERLRNLRRGASSSSVSSPRRGKARLSNSTHHHPLLEMPPADEATGGARQESSQFSDSPVELSDDDDVEEEDDDDDDEEILASISPPPSDAGASEVRTSPFPSGLDQPAPHHPLVNHNYDGGGRGGSRLADHGRRGTSAESLALNLLSSNRASTSSSAATAAAAAGEPRVCELKWLVGDWDPSDNKRNDLRGDDGGGGDAPSVVDARHGPEAAASTTTDFVSNASGDSTLRGNYKWAPPRPQLILKIHEKRSAAVALSEQGYLCRGCGTAVDPRYLRTFRYCAYFGAFFCTSCHRGGLSVLPAAVVCRWDFRERPVSDFARSVVRSLAANRLLDVEAINPELVLRVARLRRAGELRRRAATVFPYLATCKDREQPDMANLCQLAESYDSLKDPAYTLNELCLIRLGSYNRDLHAVLLRAERHVVACRWCRMRGHHCEGCRSDEVIFAFQRPDVAQCPAGGCGACFHRKCYESTVVCASGGGCGKCRRIREWRAAKAADKY